MLDKIKRTVKHTAFFAFGNIAPKLSGFILLPIYTKLISVVDYGILGLLEVIELIATHILSVGIPQALLRWHGRTDSEAKKKNYIYTIFTFLVCLCIFALIIVIPLRNMFAKFLFDKDVFGDYFIYLFASISFTVMSKIPLTVLRSEEKSFTYAICVVLQFAINLIANVYFVAMLKLGVKGVLISQTISTGFIFVSFLPYMLKRMSPHFELSELKNMLSFSYPFAFAAIASTILNLGDRYILAELATLHEVGLYTLAYKFSNIMKTFLVDAFILSLPIIGWNVIRENKRPQRFFSKTLTYLVFVLLWFGLILSAYGKGIIHRFALNRAYWDAYQVMPYLVLSIAFLGMQGLFFFELQIPKKTKYIAFIISGAASLNILLNLLLIPKFGIIGAAFATVFAQFSALICSYRVVQKVYPVSYEFKRICILFVTAISLFLITTMFNDYSLLLRIIYKGIIIASFPFILYLIRFYEPVELDRIRGSLIKWRRKFRFGE